MKFFLERDQSGYHEEQASEHKLQRQRSIAFGCSVYQYDSLSQFQLHVHNPILHAASIARPGPEKFPNEISSYVVAATVSARRQYLLLPALDAEKRVSLARNAWLAFRKALPGG